MDTFESEVRKSMKTSHTYLSAPKIVATLSTTGIGSGQVFCVHHNPNIKEALVATTQGVSILKVRALRGYAVRDCATWAAVRSVEREAIEQYTTVIFEIRVSLNDGRRINYITGSGSLATDYYGNVDASGLDGPGYVSEQVFNATSDAMNSKPPAAAAVNQPSAQLTEPETTTERLLKRIAHSGADGDLGSLPSAQVGLAEAIRLVGDVAGAGIAVHVPIVESLLEVLANILGQPATDLDDLQAVMGFPDDVPIHPAPDFENAYKLASLALITLEGSEAHSGAKPDGFTDMWRDLGDLPTELAAWYSTAVVRLGRAGLGPSIE